MVRLYHVIVLVALFTTVLQAQTPNSAAADVYVLKGHTVVLPCTTENITLDHATTSQVTWMNATGHTILVVVVNEGTAAECVYDSATDKTKYSCDADNFTLIINNSDLSDEGEYQCQDVQENGESLLALSRSLVVYVPPDYMNFHEDPPLEAIENVPHSITCMLWGAKPGRSATTFQLLYGDEVLPLTSLDEDSEQEDGTWILRSRFHVTLQRSDQDRQYRCNATWAALGELFQYSQVTPSIAVHFKPLQTVLTSNPFPLSVTEGSHVTITCTVSESMPDSNVTWTPANLGTTEDSLTITGTVHGGTRRISSLMFTATRDQDGMTVFCTPVWRDFECCSTFGTTLVVRHAPDVSVIASPSYTPEENQRLTLTCATSGGNPSEVTDYRWSLVSRYGNAYSYESRSTSGASMVINRVEFSDFGLYSCQVSHEMGDISSDQRLVNVSYAAKDLSVSPQVVQLNQSATVVATFRASPAPTMVTWLLPNGTELTGPLRSSNDVDVFTSSFEIDMVEAEDYGIYKVTVVNTVRTVQIVVLLTDTLDTSGTRRQSCSIILVWTPLMITRKILNNI